MTPFLAGAVHNLDIFGQAKLYVFGSPDKQHFKKNRNFKFVFFSLKNAKVYI